VSRQADELRHAYGTVAEEYARRFANELDHKPLDRALLRALVDETPPGALIADVGCGPGHVAAFLASNGANSLGIDLSPEMVELARRLHPSVDFSVGDMLSLPAPDGGWGSMVALYSVIHLEDDELAVACAEFARVLRPGGLALIAFHGGSEVRHLGDWWGTAVSIDVHFRSADDAAAALTGAGLHPEARLEREPYLAVEGPTARVYLLARKPAASGARVAAGPPDAPRDAPATREPPPGA
jgi:SAM-dependent methyltransferase